MGGVKKLEAMFAGQSKESDDQGVKNLEAMFAEQSKESDDQGVKKLEAMFAEQSKKSAEAHNAQATESRRSDTQGAKAPEALPKRSTPTTPVDAPTRSPAPGNRVGEAASAAQLKQNLINPRRRL